jgi:hypothetical protein
MNIIPLAATPIPDIAYIFKRQCVGHCNCKSASYGGETRKLALRYEHRLRVMLVYDFNCSPSVYVDNHTIPTKCTLLLLKAPDITICTLKYINYRL